MAIGGSMTDTTVASTRHRPSVSSETANGGRPSADSAAASGSVRPSRCSLSHALGTFAPDKVM